MIDKKPVSKKGIKVGKEGERIFITVDEQKFYEIPQSIYFLLCICDGTKTVKQMAEMLSKDSGTSLEEAEKILQTVLDELTKAGFVEWI